MTRENKKTITDDSSFKKALKEAKKSFQDNNKEFFELIKTVKESYTKKNDTLQAIVTASQESFKKSSEFRKWLLGPTQEDKAAEALKYAKKQQEIRDSNLSETQKSAGFLLNQKGFQEEVTDKDGGFLEDTLEKTAQETSESLKDIILGYKSFSEGMKSIGNELSEYMLKQMTDTLMKMIFTKQNAEAAGGVINAAGSWGGGFWRSTFGLFSKIFRHHSGGIIPVGANASLPGTQEQLALLKGGERILSPAENTSYNSAAGGSSPVVFNNFNIKAWDSKDVQKYLKENKQLLNSITYEGIKNNNNQLRNIVRNA